MGEPTTTMPRFNDSTGALRGASQKLTSTWRHRADPLFDQRPTRLGGVEVIGVRRQEFHRGPDAFDQFADSARLVGREVVEQHAVAATELRDQAPAHPRGESGGGYRAPLPGASPA